MHISLYCTDPYFGRNVVIVVCHCLQSVAWYHVNWVTSWDPTPILVSTFFLRLIDTLCYLFLNLGYDLFSSHIPLLSFYLLTFSL